MSKKTRSSEVEKPPKYIPPCYDDILQWFKPDALYLGKFGAFQAYAHLSILSVTGSGLKELEQQRGAHLAALEEAEKVINETPSQTPRLESRKGLG